MIDANSQFFAVLTNVGMAKQANADALGIAWKLTEMGVGDATRAGWLIRRIRPRRPIRLSCSTSGGASR